MPSLGFLGLNMTMVAHSFLPRVWFVAFAWWTLLAIPAQADDWPAWRGRDGSGICREKELPLRWTTNENVRWRVPLPG